jgi:hypothetical protein
MRLCDFTQLYSSNRFALCNLTQQNYHKIYEKLTIFNCMYIHNMKLQVWNIVKIQQ